MEIPTSPGNGRGLKWRRWELINSQELKPLEKDFFVPIFVFTQIV
jgi:hypothetical protein